MSKASPSHRLVGLLGGAILSVVMGGCSVQTVFPQQPADVRPQVETLAEIADRSLPGVVLLLNTRPDGQVAYGAGFLVGKEGYVLTNHHVVADGKKLGAMLYKPGRLSYTPMDGGLGRYIFENQKDIVDAEIVDAEIGADLALVKIAADTAGFPSLKFSPTKVKAGDRVIALGHPQETVWSFTSGVVGAIEHGAIQHDALLSNGSSGGPLLNERGEVVGINTAMVVSEARGLSFARPIDLADDLLSIAHKSARGALARFEAPSLLDLSSPERAVVSCWHAAELASPAMVDCIDWDASYAVYESAIDEVRRRGLDAAADRAVAYMRDHGGKQGWIDEHKRSLAASIHAQKPLAAPVDEIAIDGLTPEQAKALSDLKVIEETWQRRLLEKNGIKVDLDTGLKQLLRMGIRVDDVHMVTADLAWVLITGRNPDGTTYSYSEAWAKQGDRWLQHLPPLGGDLETLPAGFAPPINDFVVSQSRYVASVVEQEAAAVSGTGSAAEPASCRRGVSVRLAPSKH